MRELEQRERVAVGGMENRRLGCPADRRHRGLEERHGGSVVERRDVHDRLHDARELAQATGPRREDDRDAVRTEPPKDEAERITCRIVEPLDVVHQHEQRPSLGHGGEEGEETRGHGERLDTRQLHCEHGSERISL